MKLKIILSIITLNILLISIPAYGQKLPFISGGDVILYPNGDAGLESWQGSMFLNAKDMALNGWVYIGFQPIYFYAPITGIHPEVRTITFQLWFNFRDRNIFYPNPDKWEYYSTETINY